MSGKIASTGQRVFTLADLAKRDDEERKQSQARVSQVAAVQIEANNKALARSALVLEGMGVNIQDMEGTVQANRQITQANIASVRSMSEQMEGRTGQMQGLLEQMQANSERLQQCIELLDETNSETQRLRASLNGVPELIARAEETMRRSKVSCAAILEMDKLAQDVSPHEPARSWIDSAWESVKKKVCRFFWAFLAVLKTIFCCR